MSPCRALVPCSADVQVVMLRQWCVLHRQLTDSSKAASEAVVRQYRPSMQPAGVAMHQSQLLAAKKDNVQMHVPPPHKGTPYLGISLRLARQLDLCSGCHEAMLSSTPPCCVVCCAVCMPFAMQTAATLQQTAVSPAGVSCASPWRVTSLCATSHTR